MDQQDSFGVHLCLTPSAGYGFRLSCAKLVALLQQQIADDLSGETTRRQVAAVASSAVAASAVALGADKAEAIDAEELYLADTRYGSDHFLVPLRRPIFGASLLLPVGTRMCGSDEPGYFIHSGGIPLPRK